MGTLKTKLQPRKCKRFLLDIVSSRRNRLFQLQFVICLLHTPLCVHAFDKSLSKSNQRNFSKTQTCHLQTRTQRAFSCHIVTCTYSLLARHEKNFTSEVKPTWIPQFCRTPPRSYNRQQDLPSFSHTRRIQALKKECRMLCMGHHVVPSHVTMLFYEIKDQ